MSPKFVTTLNQERGNGRVLTDVTENSAKRWNTASIPREIILNLTGSKPNTNPDQKKQKIRGLTRCICSYRARTALSYCVYNYSGYFFVDERRTPIYTQDRVVCQLRPARLLPFGVKQKWRQYSLSAWPSSETYREGVKDKTPCILDIGNTSR